jgi:hypothetical protein
MSEPVKQIFRFILFILVQALVLNNMPPVHRFITPYIYFLFILWLPFYSHRISVLVISFVTGFTLDLFTKTPGLHASACLIIALIRPGLINLLIPRETKELTLGSPGIKSMGFASYAVYVIVLTLFHHVWLVMLEWMQLGSFSYFAGKVFFSFLISLLLILITELLFRPLKKSSRD